MKHVIVSSLLLVSAACAAGRSAPVVPQDPPRPGSAAQVPPAQEPFEVPSYEELMGTRRKKPGQGAWGDRWIAHAAVLPMSFVEVQQGEDAVDAGEGTWCDGPGWQLRLAGGNLDQSLGFSYQGMSLDGDRGSLDLHAVYFDADVRVPLAEGGGRMFLTGAAGIGAVMADPGDFDPQWDAELAGQVRLSLDLDVARWMSLGFGGGLVAYGHPGDTAGYGGFFLLGATIVF